MLVQVLDKLALLYLHLHHICLQFTIDIQISSFWVIAEIHVVC